ncbi:MAG: type VI secretion system baseplate subunit TssG [Planctomycetia bacterium]|nr:type VI secretion system baseplate subunit TssG [Planctomycetia bacterium]
MAAADGRARPGLIDQLLREPERFDFFQAVRLLEAAAREAANGDLRRQRLPVGYDHAPEREVVHFRNHIALSFPASAISQLKPARGKSERDALLEMVVTFFGLAGPNGVLPYHYSALLVRRMRQKDSSLSDWLDVFQHRLTSLFYRAWEKYRLPLTFERSRVTGPTAPPDPVTLGLRSFVGLGGVGLQHRLELPDDVFLHYAGLFAHYPKSAISLERALEDHFEIPVQLQQLLGQWLRLEPEDLSMMPRRGQRQGCNNRLGRNCVAGERVWEIQSKFRLRLGPLTYTQFCDLMPGAPGLRAVCQMSRVYVGPELQFDVRPVLLPAEVPWCRLQAQANYRPLLGRNTWVRSRPFTRPVDDAVFSCDDL